jgi:hypothetical protein
VNEKAQVTFPDETEISCVILGEDELGNYKCSALENNGKYKQGDIFYCNEDTHEIVKTAKLTKLSGLKNLLSNEIKKYQWGFDNHKSPWKYNKITGMIEKDPEAVKKLAKLLKTALAEPWEYYYLKNKQLVDADGNIAFEAVGFDDIESAEEFLEQQDIRGSVAGYWDINAPVRDSSKKGWIPEDFSDDEMDEYGLDDLRGIKSLSKLLKTSLQSGDEYWDNEDYGQTPRKEVRYAVEADFYVYATSDEEAFQQADAVKEVLEDKELPEVLKISDFEIKNIYKIPTGTMNFDNKPLQRQSMVKKALSYSEISQWIDNDEGLYNWWRGSRQGKTKFIQENKKELTDYINKTMHPQQYERDNMYRNSKLGGLKNILSHALDDRITTKFRNSFNAITHNLVKYDEDDNIQHLQEVADYLSDLLTVTKEQIDIHNSHGQNGESFDDDGGESKMWSAMQGGTD